MSLIRPNATAIELPQEEKTNTVDTNLDSLLQRQKINQLEQIILHQLLQIAALSKRITEILSDQTTVLLDKFKLNEKLEALTKAREDLEKKNAVLTNSKIELESKVNSLQKELNEGIETRVELENKISDLQTQKAELESKVQTLERKKDTKVDQKQARLDGFSSDSHKDSSDSHKFRSGGIQRIQVKIKRENGSHIQLRKNIIPKNNYLITEELNRHTKRKRNEQDNALNPSQPAKLRRLEKNRSTLFKEEGQHLKEAKHSGRAAHEPKTPRSSYSSSSSDS